MMLALTERCGVLAAILHMMCLSQRQSCEWWSRDRRWPRPRCFNLDSELSTWETDGRKGGNLVLASRLWSDDGSKGRLGDHALRRRARHSRPLPVPKQLSWQRVYGMLRLYFCSASVVGRVAPISCMHAYMCVGRSVGRSQSGSSSSRTFHFTTKLLASHRIASRHV